MQHKILNIHVNAFEENLNLYFIVFLYLFFIRLILYLPNVPRKKK